MQNNKYLKYIVLAIGIIIAIVSFFTLPDKVGMQISFSGEMTNYVDKPIAIILPLVLVALFDYAYVIRQQPKYLAGCAIGIICGIMTIILN